MRRRYINSIYACSRLSVLPYLFSGWVVSALQECGALGKRSLSPRKARDRVTHTQTQAGPRHTSTDSREGSPATVRSQHCVSQQGECDDGRLEHPLRVGVSSIVRYAGLFPFELAFDGMTQTQGGHTHATSLSGPQTSRTPAAPALGTPRSTRGGGGSY